MLSRVQVPLARAHWGLGELAARIEGVVISAALLGSLIAINALQMLSLVILPFSARAFRAFNRLCAGQWWSWCVLVARRAHGVRFVLTGDDLPMEENAIVVANHQQMPDIVVVMALALERGRIGDLKWFVKDVIKFVPGIGWGMLFLDCVFLKRNWDKDASHIRQTFSKFKKHQIPIWLVSFVEGTRLKLHKLQRSREFARQIGRKLPSHVLIPRTKGFVASVQGLRDHVEAVYDLTIGYEKGLPTIWQFVCGWARRIHVDVRRIPVGELPTQAEALADWLLGRFERKDDLLEAFSRSGAFGELSSLV